MDRHEISRIAHSEHPIAAPVAASQAQLLLSRLSPPKGGRVVDLGCGWGEWILRLLAQRVDLTGVGVDIALPSNVASRAVERGSADRVSWVEADAAPWGRGELFDVVLCIGASHAFGDLAATLRAARRHLRPGGQLLLGDTIWEVPPSAAALEALEAGPDDFPDLADFVAAAQEHEFEPGYGHVSTVQEWDDYEWCWTGSLAEWALRQAATAADRGHALEAARAHREAWLSGYRRQLGFVTVVLNDIRSDPDRPSTSGNPFGTAWAPR